MAGKTEKPKKLEASKEAAKEALTAFDKLCENWGVNDDESGTVSKFLETVIKKLPTEKAIAAEKQRLKDEKKAAKAK